jgi:hypothetical protein
MAAAFKIASQRGGTFNVDLTTPGGQVRTIIAPAL